MVSVSSFAKRDIVEQEEMEEGGKGKQLRSLFNLFINFIDSILGCSFYHFIKLQHSPAHIGSAHHLSSLVCQQNLPLRLSAKLISSAGKTPPLPGLTAHPSDGTTSYSAPVRHEAAEEMDVVYR